MNFWRPKVGSWWWLLRFELLLRWRELTGKMKPSYLIILLLVFVVLLPLVAWLPLREVVPGLRDSWQNIQNIGDGTSNIGLKMVKSAAEQLLQILPLFIFGSILFTLTLLNISQGITESVGALFERQDLDLLVASPVPSISIFTSRAFAVAISVLMVGLPFVLPFIILIALLGFPQLLAAIPLLVALAFFSASLGMILTLALVRWLGARRARTVAQVLSSLIGAAIFLISQFGNLTGAFRDNDPTGSLLALQNLTKAGALLAPDSLIWWPVRAAFGDPLALISIVLPCFGFFWLTTRLVHGRFMSGTQESVSATVNPSKNAQHNIKNNIKQDTTVRFRKGLLSTVLSKEWRLIARDPYLLSQIGLQVVYMIPMVFVFANSRIGAGPNGTAGQAGLAQFGLGQAFIAIIAVLMTSGLATNLTRVALNGEEALDLLQSAPVAFLRLRLIKLLAALLPVWLFVIPILSVIVIYNPTAWLALPLALGATLTAGLFELAFKGIVKRADLFKRGDAAFGLFPQLLRALHVFAWLAAAAGLASGQWWGLIGLAVAILVPLVAHWTQRSVE
jgi:ABC-2 type transport system permease protein